MDNHREQIKKDIIQSQASSEFDLEAKEGWDNIGMEHWDKIHQKLDQKIDQETLRSPISETKTVQISKKTKSWFSFKMSIAAMLLVSLGLSIKFVFDQPNQNVQLFETYYKPLDAPEDNFRSEENSEAINEKAIMASDAYDDLEYKKPINEHT